MLAAVAVLACAGPAAAQAPAGQSRSTFVPRVSSPRAELAPPAASPGVIPAQAKDKDKDKLPGTAPDPYQAYIRLDPPGREKLFGSRDTERELELRMRQERKDAGQVEQGPVQFPEAPALPWAETKYQPRAFDPMVALVEPDYVVYRRLYFEEKNAERYAWDMGPIQPLWSTLVFYKDVALWPLHFAAYPCRRFDTNAGQCRPGDPVPYLWYPPEITGTGLLAEVAAVALISYTIVP
jgi:hypothetical protein